VIPHSRPLILPEDIRAVDRVLESGMIAGGDGVGAFEAGMSSYIGRKYAAAVSSGTAALYAALAALGIGDGDEVVIPAYVCSSLLYAVRFTGASPVVADSGEDVFHPDAESIRRVISPRTKAVIFPHMFGSANDIRDIVSLGVPVIEDCALSLGSALGDVKTGNLGSYAAVFSFYATKVIAAGEGGMVLSDDAGFVERIRDMVKYADKPDERSRFNFAMTDIAAALGLSQLGRLEDMIERRRSLSSRYSEAFSSPDLVLPREKPGERHIFYRYVVRCGDVEGLRERIRRRGVCAERPVHLPLSRYPGVGVECPRAEEAWRTALSIPLYPALTDGEVGEIIDAVTESVRESRRGEHGNE